MNDFVEPCFRENTREGRKASIDQARVSCRLEGLILPPKVEELNRRYIDGEITLDEHVSLGLALADAMLSKARSTTSAD